MTLWNKILKVEKHLRNGIENAFGRQSPQTPLEIRREILEEVAARIAIDEGRKLFPFGRIVIRLLPRTDAMRAAFEASFVRDASLKEDVYRRLREARVQSPGNLEIFVQFQEDSAPDSSEASARRAFELEFVRPDELNKPEIPEVTLTVIKGSAEQGTYQMRKERILIGRLSEVLDREGRLVRKNDVAFQDNGDDINSSVGRIHARIWLDLEKRQFRIMDESSRYGTRIMRGGRSIEVPGGNPRGIRLSPGDEIYLGQACVRFDSQSS
jgi:hypothetical protein